MTYPVMTLKQLAQRGGKITRVEVEPFRAVGTTYLKLIRIEAVYGVNQDACVVDVSKAFNGVEAVPADYFKRELVRWARREGIYGHAVGLLGPNVVVVQ